jgi:hypothetical protein
VYVRRQCVSGFLAGQRGSSPLSLLHLYTLTGMFYVDEYEKLLSKKKRGIYLNQSEMRTLRFYKQKTILEKQFKTKLNLTQVRYLEKGIRYIGYWDIETSSFNPYQNFIICFCFIRRDILTGKRTKHEYFISKRDINKAVKSNNFNFDEKLLKELSQLFAKCDMIEGHYSTKFDMPYFRSRCLLTKQPDLIPAHGKLKYSDTWRKMKQSLKADRNTLNNLNLLVTGKSDKTHVDLEYWYKIRFKDSPDWEKAKKYILKHCRLDVADSYRNGKAIESFNNIPGMLT